MYLLCSLLLIKFPELFFNGRDIWHISLGTSPTSQMFCSSNKCMILPNRTLLDREMTKPSSDTRFSANHKVTTDT